MVHKDPYLWMLSSGGDYIPSTVLLLTAHRESHKYLKCPSKSPWQGSKGVISLGLSFPFYKMTE